MGRGCVWFSGVGCKHIGVHACMQPSLALPGLCWFRIRAAAAATERMYCCVVCGACCMLRCQDLHALWEDYNELYGQLEDAKAQVGQQ